MNSDGVIQYKLIPQTYNNFSTEAFSYPAVQQYIFFEHG